MAGGVNKVIIVGNLGKDPEVRFTPGGAAVANFTMATSESWTDKNGQKQERTEWHRIVAWGKTAELCGEYLKKGRQAFIEGKLQTRKWTDKEGKEHYTTEIVADRVVFLGSRSEGSGARSNDQEYGPPPPGMEDSGAPPNGAGAGAVAGDSDIPF